MFTGLKRARVFLENDLWRMDTASLDRPRAILVRAARFIYIASRDFLEGQINFRAMSLVYTSLLSLVPLLAVSFSVLKAFGVQNQIEPLLANFLAPLGPSGDEITRRIVGFVGNMKVGVLGSIGLAMLVYTAISLIYKMEDSLNYIWKIKRPRSFSRRFSDYMSVLLVGPILIFSAIGLTAAVKSNTIVQGLLSIGPLGFVFYIISLLLPYLTTSAAFTFAYVFLPSIKVRPVSALAGGLFAGITWQVSGWAFASFVASSAQYSAIYSGFAILILFMMWMYFSWLIFLVGGSVSFYHQFPQHFAVNREGIVMSGRLKERLAVTVMFLIGYNFYYNKGFCTLGSLVEKLMVPVEPVQEILLLLEENGFIVATGEVIPTYLPARDIETVSLAEIVETARTAGKGAASVEGNLPPLPEVDKAVQGLNGSLLGVLNNKTLKDMVISTGGTTQ